MVAGRREVGEGAETPARVAFRRRRPILFVALLFLGLVTALLIVAWIERRPIAERFIEQELERRGVRATYTIDSIGAIKNIERFTFAPNQVTGSYVGSTSDVTYGCANPSAGYSSKS